VDALDLRKTPPRRPRAELAGVVFLPRSIDKIRATLPGGDLGAYTISGFTATMFDMLGIALEDVTAAVRSAASDDDVAAFVREHARPGGVDAWHTYVFAREPKNGNRAEATAAYPFLAERPDLRLSLDVLEEDDRQTFRSEHEVNRTTSTEDLTIVMTQDRASIVREATIQLQPRPYFPVPIEEDVTKHQRVGGRVLAKSDHHVAIATGPSSFAIIERRTLDHDPELHEHVRIRLEHGHSHVVKAAERER
jgi:Domain of unknown function (DUF5069)